MRGKLQELTRDLDLQEFVNFLGRIPHSYLTHLYNLSDIFLFPTLFEGLGRAILEAIASGLPIITSNFGPVTELVKNEKNGLLVAPDVPEEISHAILRLLEDTSFRQELGKKSRVFAEKYSFSCVNKIEVEFIKNTINENRI